MSSIDITTLGSRVRSWLSRRRRPASEPANSVKPGRMNRKIRIQIPPTEWGAIADVVDAETGQPLACTSFDIHCDAEGGPTLKLELMDLEALIVGTWECRLVAEKPL